MSVAVSPAIGRMARLLEAIAAQPSRWWTLAELARTTHINKASAHSVLLALVDEGFVRRRARPVSYALGPTLVDLGERARQAVDLTGLAGPVLAELRQVTGCSAMVGAVRGADVVVVSAASVPHPFGMDLQPGHRTRFAAPTGTVYAAWLPEARMAAWLDRADPALSASQRRQCRDALGTVRERGYSVTIRDEGGRATREASDGDLDRGGLDVLGIGAPVFGAGGALECAVALVDPPSTGRTARTVPLARHVTVAAERLTALLGESALRAGG